MILHLGDTTIPVYTEKLTERALHIQNSAGTIFYVPLITQGECVATGTETLFYEEQSINTCKQITLEPGCYRIEIRGGDGGTNETIKPPLVSGETKTYTLNLINPTQIHLFRGGDGATAPANEFNSCQRSNNGVTSFIVTPNKIFDAPGGPASTHSHSTYTTPTGLAIDWKCLQHINSNNGFASYTEHDPVHNTLTVQAPYGGNAPDGTAGIAYNAHFSENFKYTGGAKSATSTHGGNGGNMQYITPDGTITSGTGGAGGETISYTCGGHTVYSYGSGGVGAMCYYAENSNEYGCLNGGDGASGSTNTSDTSFIKIYKL